MARCDNCGATILFGGVRHGEMRFCTSRCYETATLLTVSQQVPEGTVAQQIEAVHQGPCPRCGGSGPVDVHTAHWVVSAVFVTWSKSQPCICCRSCGVKRQIGSMAISFLLGWWGFPWGLIFTPVQVVRNLVELVRPPHPFEPSAQLQKMVRLGLASQAVNQPAA